MALEEHFKRTNFVGWKICPPPPPGRTALICAEGFSCKQERLGILFLLFHSRKAHTANQTCFLAFRGKELLPLCRLMNLSEGNSAAHWKSNREKLTDHWARPVTDTLRVHDININCPSPIDQVIWRPNHMDVAPVWRSFQEMMYRWGLFPRLKTASFWLTSEV